LCVFSRRFIKSTIKGNDKDGVGMHWEQSSIWETKKHPDYVLSNSGNREANFSGDIKFTEKQDVSAYYSYYNTTIEF
jgi:iron complex outermembrane receptor protein